VELLYSVSFGASDDSGGVAAPAAAHEAFGGVSDLASGMVTACSLVASVVTLSGASSSALGGLSTVDIHQAAR